MFRLMLVDDQAPFREVIRKMLEETAEFQIIAEAEDGRMAVTMIDGLDPDLVLMDVQMPLLNGFEAARQILEKKPKMKIALASMDDESEYSRVAREIGAVAYFRKQELSVELLLELLR
jgi:two-component system response regulator DegU